MAYPFKATSPSVMLAVGTKRGLFLLTSTDRENWTITPTNLTNSHIFYAMLDQRAGHRLFASDNGDFFGSFLRYSDDFGETWKQPTQGIAFPEGGERSLTNIWTIEPGRAETPQTVYAGVDPASLWVSEDGGDTWTMNAGLESHPTRDQWNPGAGGLCLHSIVVDPSRASRMWIGISAVGCLRTDDGGQTWSFANKNTRAGFQPDIYPEFGQCIHRLLQRPDHPDELYQQNHCGIYKTMNAGEDWIDIQGPLPSEFGFPLALDRRNADTLYVIVEEPEYRANVGEQFQVYRSQDAGANWETLATGFPAGPGVRMGVLRHGMCTDDYDPCGVYVGTNTGQLFASADRGDSWRLIADYLPPIYSVTAATLA